MIQVIKVDRGVSWRNRKGNCSCTHIFHRVAEQEVDRIKYNRLVTGFQKSFADQVNAEGGTIYGKQEFWLCWNLAFFLEEPCDAFLEFR